MIAPDLPGFGFSGAPDRGRFAYTFDHLAGVIGAFVEALELERFALYLLGLRSAGRAAYGASVS